MDTIKYYSKESLEQLKEELKHLESVERPKISAAIAEARDKGDLSENAEYDAAKEAQGMLELKIAKLKNLVANARILDESKIDVSKILIYSKVQVKNLQNNAVMSYTLVPESESDLKAGKISVTSPIAKALIGKQKGEVVEVKVPVGIIKLEIMDVTR
ncbi:MAG: transcription elongation factor GreA [Bacteroidales bacterium]|jgi:transcription elongation factor GreA|nr:transcription elongation factor GreA [Bacteroidota bacterium]MBQ9507983.1 transcription elongation factor GreA [Bacteroidales bacterium]MBR6062931.1 transcription elongation factor GreA [Bacteroidales bacterium]